MDSFTTRVLKVCPIQKYNKMAMGKLKLYCSGSGNKSLKISRCQLFWETVHFLIKEGDQNLDKGAWLRKTLKPEFHFLNSEVVHDAAQMQTTIMVSKAISSANFWHIIGVHLLCKSGFRFSFWPLEMLATFTFYNSVFITFRISIAQKENLIPLS